MTVSISLKSRSSPHGLLRKLGVSALALAMFAGGATPSLAAITNDATANGTPAAGTLTPATDSESVPVAPGTPVLTVAKSAASPVETGSDGVINAGDTITYTYVITNGPLSNVTINNVIPIDTGPTFNNIAGTGTMGAFTTVAPDDDLAPGESITFTAIYILSDEDAYRAAGLVAATDDAVENSATATGTPTAGTLAPVTASTAETEIPANPKLSLVKSYVFTTDNGTIGQADVGDVIEYRYDVENTGNVVVSGIDIDDVHEGTPLVTPPGGETITAEGPLATSTALPANGTVETLQPGATARFIYTHTVIQAEVDGG